MNRTKKNILVNSCMWLAYIFSEFIYYKINIRFTKTFFHNNNYHEICSDKAENVFKGKDRE